MDMQKQEEHNFFEYLISLLILIPVSLVFILKEFSNDVRTYQGVARLTDYFGAFPSNVDLAYESKPIANRLLNYILYKVSSLFTTFGSPEYEMLIKFIAVICVIIICYYFSTKIKTKYIFLLSSLAFLTPLNFTTLVPDWWSPLFALLALSLFLTDNQRNHYLAGIIITIICLLKGPTIILVIPIACSLYLLNKKDWIQSLSRGAIGSFLFLLIILLCGVFKNIIPDMLILGSYGHLGSYNISEIILGFTKILIPTFLFIPIIIVGFISALIIYFNFIKTKQFKKLLIFVMMWISVIFYICIQNMFFPYHYMSLVLPSLLSIIILSDKSIIKKFITVIIIIFTILSLLGTIMNVEEGTGNSLIAKNAMSNLIDLSNQDTILYLESGSAPYYFERNTSCRFIQSLPFQMNTEFWDITNTPQYQENYKCIMNYQNKYIIIDEIWFKQNTSDSKNVMNKIHTNYTLVWTDGWSIYQNKEMI